VKIFAIDIGGSAVTVMATGQDAAREFESGPSPTPRRMISKIRARVPQWHYDAVSVGYPGPVHGRQIVSNHSPKRTAKFMTQPTQFLISRGRDLSLTIHDTLVLMGANVFHSMHELCQKSICIFRNNITNGGTII
jgi:hypothetical protein